MARMIGKTRQPFCGKRCCHTEITPVDKRIGSKSAKAREKRAWKKES